MYNHRIVPGNTTAHSRLFIDQKDRNIYWDDADTIPITSEWDAQQLKALAEITKSEWDEIVMSWCAWFSDEIPFSRHLFILISLAPLKGMTVEEIKKLSEVKE